MRDLTPVVQMVLVGCTAVFVGQMLGAVDVRLFAQVNLLVTQGEWWRMVTMILLHGGVFHLACNMFALAILGPDVERSVGSGPFAALYLASGVAGSVAYYLLGSPYAIAVGASGAIFGLFGTWLVAAHSARDTPAGALLFKRTLTLLAINLALPLLIPNIAWQAHLGGLLGGMAVGAGWRALRGRANTSSNRMAVAVSVAAASLLLASVG